MHEKGKKMKKHITHANVKKELLKNPHVSAAYKKLEEEFQIIRKMLVPQKTLHH